MSPDTPPTPHQLHITGPYAKRLYNARLHLNQQVREGRGLRYTPAADPAWVEQTIGVASLLNQLEGTALCRHPTLPVVFPLSQTFPPALAHLLSMGDYAQAQLELVHSFTQTGDVVLDLGAGLGLASILALKAGASKAIAVEPNPAMQNLLHSTAGHNGVVVEVVAGALVPGQTQGDTAFYWGDEPWLGSIFPLAETDSGLAISTVPVVNLKTLCAQTQPQLLVVDVHGAELNLFAAGALAEAASVRHIILTAHVPKTGEKALADSLAHLGQQGFYPRQWQDHTLLLQRG